MRKLKIGIIGLGIGEKHIVEYADHPQCELVAVCDFSQDKLRSVLRTYSGIRGMMDANELLDDPEIDMVSIASYDNYHCSQILRAIQNGKHVFVEKPLCLFEQEALRIRSAMLEQPSVHLSSNLVLRTCPRFIRMREALEHGEFGEIYYFQGDYLWGRTHKLIDGWRKDMEFYSIVHGAAVHMIDLMLWMTEKRPVEVTAFGNRIATAGSALLYNDFAAALLKFDDGMIAHVTAHGGCAHPHFHQVQLFGTRKTCIHNSLGGKWFDSSNPEKVPLALNEEYPGKRTQREVLRSFVDAILNETVRPVVPADDVFETMSVCFAIEQAIETRKAVRINYI